MRILNPCDQQHTDDYMDLNQDDSNPNLKNAALMQYSMLRILRSGHSHQISAVFPTCSITRAKKKKKKKAKAKREELPHDTVQDILVNLPVKTLIKFLSVSKPWCSLISHPSFQKDHYRLRLQRDPLLLLARYDKFDKVSGTTTLYLSTHDSNKGTLINNFSTTIPHSFDSPLVLYSCQGLVCISDSENILLSNPATREIISLPLTKLPNENIGFGYVTSTKEFKVVRFFDPDPESQTKYLCQIFTLGTSGWREARCPPYQGSYADGVPFLYGSIHLLPFPNKSSVDQCIHAFDIQSEEYTSVPLPESYFSVNQRGDYAYMYLTKLGGSLCLNFYSYSVLELWLLDDYHNGVWVKGYEIDLTTFDCNVRGEALERMGDGNILMSFFLVRGQKHEEVLYLYDPRDGTFSQKANEIYSAALYVESFLSPKVLCNHLETTAFCRKEVIVTQQQGLASVSG